MNYDYIINEIEKVLNDINKDDITNTECYFDIAERNLDKFKELLTLEEVWYEVNNDFDKIKLSTSGLIEEAQKTQNSELYLELLNILNNVKNVGYDKLVYILGYLVLKDDLTKFLDITKKLHIGPYKPIVKINNLETKILKESLNKRRSQFKRINDKLEIKKKESISKTINIEDKVIGLLYGSGRINDEDILFLSENLSSEEYQTITDSLLNYDIIDNEKHSTLSNVNKTDFDNSASEVANFIINSGIKIQDIDFVNNSNFTNSLLFELFKLGYINSDEYEEMLESLRGTRKNG